MEVLQLGSLHGEFNKGQDLLVDAQDWLVRITLTQRDIIAAAPRETVTLRQLRDDPVPDGVICFIDCDRGSTIKWSRFYARFDQPASFKYCSARTHVLFPRRVKHFSLRASDKPAVPIYFSYHYYPQAEGVPYVPGRLDKLWTLRVLQRRFPVDIELWELFNHGPMPDFEVVLPELDYVDKDYQYEMQEVEPITFGYFARKIDEALATRTDEVPNFSGHAIGDICYSPALVQFCGPRKEASVADVIEAVNISGFNNVVGMIPKVGSYTSLGYNRIVFPMHLSYEAVLRRFWRNARVDDPRIFKSFTEFPKDPHVKSYDIISSEKKIWPYFINYAKLTRREFLLPLVLDGDGRLRKLDRFPSGVFGTNIVTNAFTLALVDSMGISLDGGGVQGDGVLTCAEEPIIDHPWFRHNEDGTLNGFRMTNSEVYYDRWKLKLATPRALHPGLTGKLRASLLLATYRMLGAKGLPDIDLGDMYQGKSWKNIDKFELAMFCRAHNARMCHQLFEHSSKSNCSNWDAFKVVSDRQINYADCPLPLMKLPSFE